MSGGNDSLRQPEPDRQKPLRLCKLESADCVGGKRRQELEIDHDVFRRRSGVAVNRAGPDRIDAGAGLAECQPYGLGVRRAVVADSPPRFGNVASLPVRPVQVAARGGVRFAVPGRPLEAAPFDEHVDHAALPAVGHDQTATQVRERGVRVPSQPAR